MVDGQELWPDSNQWIFTRLLELICQYHQLVYIGKEVTIDFSECSGTKRYLNRAGFFDLLNNRVQVLPDWPKHSHAEIYRGENDGLVEYGVIDPECPNQEIPVLLMKSFIAHSEPQYTDAAFTVISELFGNVVDHSNTKISGFAALQKYGGIKKHIQTVVSDSGDGIATTLKSTLKQHYPKIHKKLKLNSIDSDIYLVKKAFNEGGLSQFGSDPEQGRGIGLNLSQKYAEKYNANLSVRQETFTLDMLFKSGKLVGVTPVTNLPRILGTHVCFDFIVE